MKKRFPEHWDLQKYQAVQCRKCKGDVLSLMQVILFYIQLDEKPTEVCTSYEKLAAINAVSFH